MLPKTIIERLKHFYSPEEARLWLHTPHPLLGGAPAADLMREGRTDEVLTVIESLRAGTYT